MTDKLLTKEQVEAIAARAEAATPGPWERHNEEIILALRRNRAFILAARSDVPALIATLRAAWLERDQSIEDTVREIGIQGQLLGTIADLETEIEKLKAEREAAIADKGRAWAAQDHAIDAIEGLEKQRDAYRGALRRLVSPPPTEWFNESPHCRDCGHTENESGEKSHMDGCRVGEALKLLERGSDYGEN